MSRNDYERGYYGGKVNGATLERAACAELVRAAGCLCHELLHGGQAVFRASGHYQSAVQTHDPRCPQALAAAILARGKP